MQRRLFFEYAAVAALSVLRLLLAGPIYMPLLDDYIQYHNYAHLMGGFASAVKTLGLFAARPIAGLLDIVLWSRFYENLFVAVILIALLYAASAVVFRRLFEAGSFFYVVYLLFPLNLEGTYWLSAATRIVPALLLAGLAGTYAKGKKPFAAGICCLLAAGFYEQGFVLAAGLVIWYATTRRDWRVAAIPPVCFGLYFFITRLAGDSALYGGRTQYVMPWEIFGSVTGQIWSVLKGGAIITVKGAARGLTTGVWAFALMAVCLYIVWSLHNNSTGRPHMILLGLAFAAGPLAPFFVISNPWVSMRAAACCIPGLALAADAALGSRRTVSTVLAAVFLFATASELADYVSVARYDAAVLTALAQATEGMGRVENVGVYGLEPYILPEQNYIWHEHIHGVTESRWALTGGLRAVANSMDVPTVTPLAKNIYIDYADLSQYDCFLKIDNGMTITEVPSK